jgi:hypothetical protein
MYCIGDGVAVMKVSAIQREALLALVGHGGAIDGGSRYVERGRFVRAPVLLFTRHGTFTMATVRALTRLKLVEIADGRVALTDKGENLVTKLTFDVKKAK